MRFFKGRLVDVIEYDMKQVKDVCTLKNENNHESLNNQKICNAVLLKLQKTLDEFKNDEKNSIVFEKSYGPKSKHSYLMPYMNALNEMAQIKNRNRYAQVETVRFTREQLDKAERVLPNDMLEEFDPYKICLK